MTKNVLMTLLARHGNNNLIALGINDIASVTYFVGKYDKFRPDMIEVIDGHDILKVNAYLPNKKTGKKDIPITRYHNLEDVQSIMFINNESDLENLDLNEFYVLY